MSAPEFSAKQGDSGSLIQQSVTFDFATNLTGATAQFIYRNADGENVTRPATIVPSSPSEGAATSAVLKRILTTFDVTTAGYYPFEWKITLADGSPITRPKMPDDDENPCRAHQVFQVIEALSVGEAESTEDGVDVLPSRYMVVDDLDELAGLPWSENYVAALVLRDANGFTKNFEWDATITTGDADPNNIIPLTDIRGGGWRELQ